MKKLFLTVLSISCLTLSAFAGDKEDVLATFDKYVKDVNSYSTNIPKYYVDNARIVRIVNKKQGGQRSILIPFDRYLKELEGHSGLAKLVGYKNTYNNRKIEKTMSSTPKCK